VPFSTVEYRLTPEYIPPGRFHFHLVGPGF
jgi:hypothetical protein